MPRENPYAIRSICFVGTSRTGLGHLRRMTTIANAVARLHPDLSLALLTNADVEGLPPSDLDVFSQIIRGERSEMAECLRQTAPDIAVLDTIQIPGFETFGGRRVLILRETPDEKVADFRLRDHARWDRVIVPNPAEHWMPGFGTDAAKRIDAVGWIYRETGLRQPGDKSFGVVVASGGGGKAGTRTNLYGMIDGVLSRARERTSLPFRVRQALGPRARDGGQLNEADEVFDPGGDLNLVFRAADVVISTAGYNSILELATTDTPAMIVAIPRSLDDQDARVRLWGPRLGFGLAENNIEAASGWLADRIASPRRRSSLDIPPSGEDAAARIILDLTHADCG